MGAQENTTVMSSVETRHVARDSLFLFADLVVEGQAEDARVKVRNLSAGGMMADGSGLVVARGDRVTVQLRNVGDVKGSVAWVQGNRFGIAFDAEIDPKLVRDPVGDGDKAPRFTRPVLDSSPYHPDETRLRKL